MKSTYSDAPEGAAAYTAIEVWEIISNAHYNDHSLMPFASDDRQCAKWIAASIAQYAVKLWYNPHLTSQQRSSFGSFRQDFLPRFIPCCAKQLQQSQNTVHIDLAAILRELTGACGVETTGSHAGYSEVVLG